MPDDEMKTHEVLAEKLDHCLKSEGFAVLWSCYQVRLANLQKQKVDWSVRGARNSTEALTNLAYLEGAIDGLIEFASWVQELPGLLRSGVIPGQEQRS